MVFKGILCRRRGPIQASLLYLATIIYHLLDAKILFNYVKLCESVYLTVYER